MFIVLGMFFILMVGFAVVDFFERRETRKKEAHRSMLWAPKVRR